MGIVEEVRGSRLLLEVGKPQPVPRPPVQIALGFSLPAGGKMAETIVQQAVQMGVCRIIPLMTARCVVRLSAGKVSARQERLRRVAAEALKQSGTAWFPEIEPVTSWEKIVPRFKQFSPALIAATEGPYEPLDALFPPSLPKESPREVLLLIGPEGDFTPEEVLQAVQGGAHRLSLGPSILRCETACVAAVSIVSFLLREAKSHSCHP